MIVFMRDQQVYKSEAAKERNIFKKEIVPQNLILLQEKCYLCSATLSNPITVSANAFVVTFQKVFKDYISHVKQCLFCGDSIDIRHAYMGFTIMMIVFYGY